MSKIDKELRCIEKHVYMTPQQWKKIENDLTHSTCNSFSEYVRKVIMKKPITLFHRNQSFDEFIDIMIVWRKEVREILGKPTLTENDVNVLKQLFKQIQEGINKLVDLCSLK